MVRKLAIVGLVALSAALSLTLSGPAASPGATQVSAAPPKPGDLDAAFDGDGKALTDLGHSDAIEDLAVQGDGKIVAVGQTQDGYTTHFALVRYERNGSLDPSFGAGGKIITDFGRIENRAFAVALQSNGKIVVAGVAGTGAASTGSDFALARYNVDGSLDASFGIGGKVVTDFNLTHEAAFATAIQPDGRIVVLGPTRPFGPVTTNPDDFALARYNSNGSLDTSFGGDGKVSTGFNPGWTDRGWGLALTREGKIVAAGYAYNPTASGPAVIDVARYNPDGSLDASFGGDGTVVTASSDSRAYGVVVQPDGRIVVAGYAGQKFALVRYTVDGNLDTTFGTGGIASQGFGTKMAWAEGLARQPDGKLVAAGVTRPSDGSLDYSFAVARFEASGRVDTSFGGGAVMTDFGATTTDEGRGLALQPDGKIVVGGYSSGDFALARYVAAPSCRVPNVLGKKLGVAKSSITKAHCSVGRVKRQASKKVKRNRVVSQRPHAGATLPNLSKVNLVVSKGRRP